MAALTQRLKELDDIERDITTAMQSAGQAILELSKDKPSLKQVESQTSNFIKTLENVESGLMKHITYLTQVSTGQAHEGSSYASQKDLSMAWHRIHHARARLMELERLKNKHIQ
ncbi:mediator complex subunit 11 [Tachypleus tridentatus]|uniref:mediator complex subunit 11 n=1 Tax=Tachypleus tridentatus TaxID=6853 RepID=UPI003FD5970B